MVHLRLQHRQEAGGRQRSLCKPPCEYARFRCSRVQGFGEILFDDQGSAGGIDQEGGGFHPGEAFGVDQALGFRREGAMEADGIALGKQLVEGGVFDSLGRCAGHVAAVGEEAHAEGLADAGDGPADLAQADQPAVLAPARGGEVPRSALDAGRAGIHLGWKPWTELAVGSAAVLDFFHAKS